MANKKLEIRDDLVEGIKEHGADRYANGMLDMYRAELQACMKYYNEYIAQNVTTNAVQQEETEKNYGMRETELERAQEAFRLTSGIPPKP